MKESKIERKLLWYKYSESNPELHHWNFVIINELSQIRIIKQKAKGPLIFQRPFSYLSNKIY
jgi:hypothetical protein